MAEENQVENQTEDNDNLSDVEKLAMEQGWKPQDEYEGEADWVPAEIWVARTPLFEKIEQQKAQHKRELKELKSAFQSMRESFDKQLQGEYDRALKELQARKREAIKEGDLEYAADLEEQIDAHKETAPKPAEAFTVDSGAAFIETWRGQNSWYGKDTDRTDLFDGFFMSKFNKTKDLEEAVTFAEQQMKKVEGGTEEKKVSKVSDGGKPSKTVKPKASKVDLPEEALRAMKTFVRAGIMTEEEYIKQYQKSDQE